MSAIIFILSTTLSNIKLYRPQFSTPLQPPLFNCQCSFCSLGSCLIIYCCFGIISLSQCTVTHITQEKGGERMYKYYYFNDNTDKNGNHEVHSEGCSFLPSVSNRTYIGYYSSCSDAIAAAKAKYPYKSFDGCYYCCNPCHKG